jgi:hypothetical protein
VTNDSASGGYLAPEADLTPDGDSLDDALQVLVAGVTGLDGTLVRPRWQPEPPLSPDKRVTWCAVGVQSQTPDANPYEMHDPAGDGDTTMQRHETLDVLVSFYGPQSQVTAGVLRDGLFIGQNRETARAQGLALVEVGPLRRVPDLINQIWRNRVDLGITFRRQVNRTYPIRNLLSAAGTIQSDAPLTVAVDTSLEQPA